MHIHNPTQYHPLLLARSFFSLLGSFSTLIHIVCIFSKQKFTLFFRGHLCGELFFLNLLNKSPIFYAIYNCIWRCFFFYCVLRHSDSRSRLNLLSISLYLFLPCGSLFFVELFLISILYHVNLIKFISLYIPFPLNRVWSPR